VLGKRGRGKYVPGSRRVLGALMAGWLGDRSKMAERSKAPRYGSSPSIPTFVAKCPVVREGVSLLFLHPVSITTTIHTTPESFGMEAEVCTYREAVQGKWEIFPHQHRWVEEEHGFPPPNPSSPKLPSLYPLRPSIHACIYANLAASQPELQPPLHLPFLPHTTLPAFWPGL
jgi:hypothetical protein